jgi:hypothetical protein
MDYSALHRTISADHNLLSAHTVLIDERVEETTTSIRKGHKHQRYNFTAAPQSFS